MVHNMSFFLFLYANPQKALIVICGSMRRPLDPGGECVKLRIIPEGFKHYAAFDITCLIMRSIEIGKDPPDWVTQVCDLFFTGNGRFSALIYRSIFLYFLYCIVKV